MPYMPDDEKERLKKEISIQRLAEARGIKLRRVGKELIGLCPFHDDRNPSLQCVGRTSGVRGVGDPQPGFLYRVCKNQTPPGQFVTPSGL
jgi:hypothetical protein